MHQHQNNSHTNSSLSNDTWNITHPLIYPHMIFLDTPSHLRSKYTSWHTLAGLQQSDHSAVLHLVCLSFVGSVSAGDTNVERYTEPVRHRYHQRWWHQSQSILLWASALGWWLWCAYCLEFLGNSDFNPNLSHPIHLNRFSLTIKVSAVQIPSQTLTLS